ncbi:MAG: DMT family transporter [Bacteroidetes bacterium]|nr:DMT family transporter [Bacteroidota bacterium]
MKTDFVKLHFVVIILGFTAILGKLISIDAVNLVWYRTLIGAVTSLIVVLITKKKLNIGWPKIFRLLSIGLIVGAHWICFFHAIKVSNVSVALVCLSTTTLFTAVVEPLTQSRRISLLEVFIGIFVIIGLNTIFRFEPQYSEGIFYGILCAILAGIFSILNKNISEKFEPIVLNFYEMMGAWIGVGLFIVFSGGVSSFPYSLPDSDYVYLLLLGTVCTSYAFTATVELMKRLSAYTIILTINLEPV